MSGNDNNKSIHDSAAEFLIFSGQAGKQVIKKRHENHTPPVHSRKR